jgi:hypothetical protein
MSPQNHAPDIAKFFFHIAQTKLHRRRLRFITLHHKFRSPLAHSSCDIQEAR